jgi:hypothetical protein
LSSSASQLFTCLLQGIAAAAAGPTAEYGDCVEVLLPLVQQLTRDPEAEIRATVVKQLPGLGETTVAAAAAEHSYRCLLDVALLQHGAVCWSVGPAVLTTSVLCPAGTALFDKDAERSMRDIEATLLVCAQQCALDDEDDVG